jgi:hypothetical protein
VTLSLIAFTIALVVSQTTAQLNATRVGVQLSRAALAQVSVEATAQLAAYIASHEPLAVPDQQVSVFGLTTLKLTHLSLFNFSFADLRLACDDGVGLTLDLGSLAGQLAFDADWLFTAVSSVAHFNASLSATLALQPGADVTALPVVSLAAFRFKIHSLAFHNTSSAIWQIIFDFTDEIASLVSSSVEQTVPATVVADVAALLPSFFPFATVGNVTWLTSLTAPPIFSAADGVSLFVAASPVLDASTNATCALPAAPIAFDAAPSRAVQLYVSQSLVDCVLASPAGAALLDSTIAGVVAKLQLSHKLALTVVPSSAPFVSFLSGGVALALGVVVDVAHVGAFSRHAVGGASVGIALAVNVTGAASVSVGVDAASQNFTAGGQVSSVGAQVGVAPGFVFSPDFPAKFRQQIDATDFGRLSGMLTALLNTTVLDQLNAKLAQNVTTPLHLPLTGVNPVVSWRDGLMVVGVDVPAALVAGVTAQRAAAAASACAADAAAQSRRDARTTCQ